MIQSCSFCCNFLTDKEIKYGKTILFSLMCKICYNRYKKQEAKLN